MEVFMKALTAALMATAVVVAPLSASAQGHAHAGAVHAAGRPAGGFGHAGYGRAGFVGGYRGGYGHYWGGPYWGGFGFGLALGAAWADPWYYADYYPWYYGYPVAYYGPAPVYSYADVYDDEAGPPPAPTSAAPQAPSALGGSAAQVCGQWVWHADAGRYQWVSSNCPS